MRKYPWNGEIQGNLWWVVVILNESSQIIVFILSRILLEVRIHELPPIVVFFRTRIFKVFFHRNIEKRQSSSILRI
jgi:hypothetical protein